MVLLWGLTSDGPLAQVQAALARMGTAVAFLDQQNVLQSEVELRLDDVVRGTLKSPGWTLDLESVSAVYLRPYDTRRLLALQGVNTGSGSYHRALAFEGALTCWVEMTPALAVNRPSAMASNNSKPYQLQLIRAAGFDVPDTLVTTDPCAATEFWDQHGEVIYKSVSGIRSIVTKLSAEHRERLPDVCACPTQFQQYIEGTDYRVHVVGEDLIGCEIHSAAHDYRYPQRQAADVRLKSCEIPGEIADRCRRLAASLALPVVGIDLRRTASGCWYCFEANPSPGFSFYEEATGQPIAAAIARLLARGAQLS
jgi:hypothetical protein